MKIGNMDMSIDEMKQLDEAGLLQKVVTAAAGAEAPKKTSRRKRKPSINGAPMDLEGVEIKADGDSLEFKHPDYNSRKRGGYPLADIRTAAEIIEAKGEKAFVDANGEINRNRKTGVGFVSVNGGVIGENLVKICSDAGLL